MTYPGSIQTYGQPAPKSPNKATAAQVILGGFAAYAAFQAVVAILSASAHSTGSTIPTWQIYVAAGACGLVLGFIIGRIAKASSAQYSRGRGIGIAFGAGVVHYVLLEAVQLGIQAAAGQFNSDTVGDQLVDGLKYGGVLTLGLMIGAAVVGPATSAFASSGPTYIGVSSGPTSSPSSTSTVAPQPQSTVGRSPYRSSGSTTSTSTYPTSPYGTSSGGSSTSNSPFPNSPYGNPPGR